ncbi:MAG: hypothetical protein B6229_07375 [Spirochaetaceae bacterium 4572_7]|nr:MAG: hypothetical protein B6229_07375 [Spirochaetaceae bacterium 4572_7]
MKQYKRGIQAYKSVSTGTLVKTAQTSSQVKRSKKRPEEVISAPGLIKKTREENKFTKVAKLLMVLGKEEASKVISHLPANDIEAVSMEITKIDRVGKSEASILLREFGKDISAFNRNQGGVETARSMLVSAFGQDEGNKILYQAVPDSADKPFSFLKDLDFNQRMLVLRKESSSVLTIVLSNLSAKYSSPIIESLPPEQQKDIAVRLIKLKRVSPQVINIISENLKDKIKKLGSMDDMDIDGRGALADILKHMDRDNEKNILKDIDDQDPFLGEIIRDRLYTIDIIYNLNPIDFQKIIHELTDNELVYLIKGESKDVQEKIWESISSGRKFLIEAEMESVGLIKKSDADKMTKTFIEKIQKKEESGELILSSDDDDWIY